MREVRPLFGARFRSLHQRPSIAMDETQRDGHTELLAKPGEEECHTITGTMSAHERVDATAARTHVVDGEELVTSIEGRAVYGCVARDGSDNPPATHLAHADAERGEAGGIGRGVEAKPVPIEHLRVVEFLGGVENIGAVS